MKLSMINILTESHEDDVRKRLKDEFDKENRITKEIYSSQNQAQYEILMFLSDLGFDTQEQISGLQNQFLEPGFGDTIGNFLIYNFIKEHRKILPKNLTYSQEDEEWDKSMNNTIIPKIKEILNKYRLKFKEVLYGSGNMLINFDIPNKDLIHSKKYPKFVMDNPNKLMSSREFMGVEERKEKRKTIKFYVEGIPYKFLVNPLDQDKRLGSGDKGLFSNILGGALKDVFNINDNTSFEKCILQIVHEYRPRNFVMGEDINDFYWLEDVKKFMENQDNPVKKIDQHSPYYSALIDLRKIYEQIKSTNPKMIIFFFLNGRDVKHDPFKYIFKDKNNKPIYPYILY